MTRDEARELLKRPIEYDLEFLVASAFRLKDQRHVAAAREVLAERERRYEALFAYFGIPRSRPTAEYELIMIMGEQLFPSGFRLVRRGEKYRGRDTRWTTLALVDLWDVIGSFRGAGLTVEDAACIVEELKLIPAPVPDVKTIVEHYYQADRLMRRLHSGKASQFEEFDVATHVHGLTPGPQEEPGFSGK